MRERRVLGVEEGKGTEVAQVGGCGASCPGTNGGGKGTERMGLGGRCTKGFAEEGEVGARDLGQGGGWREIWRWRVGWLLEGACREFDRLRSRLRWGRVMGG